MLLTFSVDSQDIDFPPNSEELSQWVAQLEGEVYEMDKTVSKAKGKLSELSNAVAQRERCAWHCQAASEDQARQHKKDQEGLHARIAALELELVACRRPPPRKKESEIQMIYSHIQNDCHECNARISSHQISPLPSTSGHQPQQGQQGQGRDYSQGKTLDGNGGKQLRMDKKEEKEDRRPKPARKQKDYK